MSTMFMAEGECGRRSELATVPLTPNTGRTSDPSRSLPMRGEVVPLAKHSNGGAMASSGCFQFG